MTNSFSISDSDLKKTKQNADKSKELNNLVLEYKEIEQVSNCTVNFAVEVRANSHNVFQAIESQHSRDKLFESLNTELERSALEMDVKFQDEKIEALRHQVDNLKDENTKLDKRLESARVEAVQLDGFLKNLTKSLLEGTLHNNDKYAILNKCTQYSLLSNSLTENLLTCGELGFV